MEWLASEDPIIACSTGTTENTAISVLRISGLKDLSQVQAFFKKDLSTLEPRTAYFLKLYEDDDLLDEVVLIFFKGPNSYNGENIIEISAHGNPLNIKRIISAFNKSGIRTAEPGEMTYRALRNKKLTMSQVEGLDTLLNANSFEMISQGLSNLGGSLQKEYLNLKDLYLNLKSSIEIMIDFSEDVGEEKSLENYKNSFSEFKTFVSSLKNRTLSPRSHLLKPKVVLLGITNAGKSTLFNEFIQEKRAIVSNIKGTTRDYISEYFFYSGSEYQVIDTAGIRESDDKIEMEGIKLSKQLYEDSFFKILVINPFLDDSEFVPAVKPDAVVFTHSDEDGFEEKLSKFKDLGLNMPLYCTGSIGAEFKFGSIGADFKIGPIGPSSKTGPMGANLSGSIGPLGQIKEQIHNKYKELASVNPILPDRQRNNINNLSSILDQISLESGQQFDPAIISNEINNLESPISALLGVTTADDVLNNIFSNFCIGK